MLKSIKLAHANGYRCGMAGGTMRDWPPHLADRFFLRLFWIDGLREGTHTRVKNWVKLALTDRPVYYFNLEKE